MFKKLVTCNNAIEAELLKGALEDMDIPCIIQGEVTSLMYGGIGALPVVLLVDDKDMQRAKAFLSEREGAQEEAGAMPEGAGALQEDAGN